MRETCPGMPFMSCKLDLWDKDFRYQYTYRFLRSVSELKILWVLIWICMVYKC